MTPAPVTGRRTILSRTPRLWPLIIWVLVTAVCYSFLPGAVWAAVRWLLGAALLIEVIFLVSRKFRPQA
ncbi:MULTISPECIES: hypothetical protein [Actinomyces]|uniref:hypothetical protein n=1 Tax=Actinomyces TaxID=1654 RepID=UPI00135C690D|nr:MULTISPECIES: hypothetical protein [Actinomyces]